MNTKLDTTRIDNSVEKLKAELAKAEESRAKIVKSGEHFLAIVEPGEHFLAIVEPLLKRRHIKIESTQVYFNDVTTEHERGLVHLKFEEPISDKRAKKLESVIRDAGVPCPAGTFKYDITITLYDETFVE